MLDFSFLKEYMSKGGLNLQVIKCPSCGGTVEFPQSGDKTVCKYCNNTILAQDIFEKVKGLIG
jgi:DNA-directed RNA polymerase subunit RPC12/RpoP